MRRILVLAAFQTLAILAWASYHEYVWATAPTFRIPLRPRDPFDLIRGRYFVLNPLDSSIDWQSPLFPRADVERLAGNSGGFAAHENQEGWELDVSYRPGLVAVPRRLVFKGTPIDLR